MLEGTPLGVGRRASFSFTISLSTPTLRGVASPSRLFIGAAPPVNPVRVVAARVRHRAM